MSISLAAVTPCYVYLASLCLLKGQMRCAALKRLPHGALSVVFLNSQNTFYYHTDSCKTTPRTRAQTGPDQSYGVLSGELQQQAGGPEQMADVMCDTTQCI